MDTLWQYLRHGIRMLGRRPGTTAVLVLTLALGIGANSAIFSVVDAVLLRPLPYPDAGRLVNLYEHNLARGFSRFSIAAQDFADWQSQSRGFDGMALYTARAANLTGGAEPRRVIYVRFSLSGVRVGRSGAHATSPLPQSSNPPPYSHDGHETGGRRLCRLLCGA